MRRYHSPIPEFALAYKCFSAKKMKVDELIALGGVPPPTPSSPLSTEMMDEITKLYYELYMRGLALFFESRWYELKDSQGENSAFTSVLHQNPPTLALFTSFLQTISEVKSTHPRDLDYSSHLESSLIWALARLPETLLPKEGPHQSNGVAPSDGSPWETINRVQVFETLVSGETLLYNPLVPPTIENISTARQHELEFWYQLAEYLQERHASSSPSDVATRELHLGQLRARLDGRENRDVLYSMVVLREYTARWDAATNEQTVPSHLEESDPRCKLAVATRFIRDEAASSGGSGGTTNVVRRLADVAYRSFVRPGVNAGSRLRRGG
jgi:white-opaque regulator 2